VPLLSRAAVAASLILCLSCAHRAKPATGAGPVTREDLAGLWRRAVGEYTQGHWAKSAAIFERLTLELPAGDTLVTEAHFRLAECYFGEGSQLQAAREFRKVSDHSPNARLAPMALLRAGDAYADLWRRPELDPTYGQTAQATYQELLNAFWTGHDPTQRSWSRQYASIIFVHTEEQRRLAAESRARAAMLSLARSWRGTNGEAQT
jgi:TolA-binding protein